MFVAVVAVFTVVDIVVDVAAVVDAEVDIAVIAVVCIANFANAVGHVYGVDDVAAYDADVAVVFAVAAAIVMAVAVFPCEASLSRSAMCLRCLVWSWFLSLYPILTLCFFGQALGLFDPIIIASLFG